jgi:hypothetical protein
LTVIFYQWPLLQRGRQKTSAQTDQEADENSACHDGHSRLLWLCQARGHA